MSAPALLDLNDTNLQLWHADSTTQSPGYALLDGRQYTFGKAARNAARLRPRDINTRYWWQLNTEKLQPALGPARHTADLVHAHLLDLHKQGGKPDKIVLAVPGSMARDQLALLLGVIGQCPFNAVGLVNRSVLLASHYLANSGPVPGKLFHLEIQLHQAVITELGRNDGQLELRQTIPLPGCGLLQLQERLIELIATAFVRQTRFDPRRKADSEQQLYDALPDVLRKLNNSPEANVEVMGYRARVARTELRTAGELLFSNTADSTGILHADDHIIVDPLAALLPGLVDKLPRAIAVDTNSLPAALDQHREILLAGQNNSEQDSLAFISALPCLDQVSANNTPKAQRTEPEPVETPQPLRPAPSHLLIDALATPLNPSGTVLGNGSELFCESNMWQLRGPAEIRVNAERYTPGQALYCADQLSWQSPDGSDTVALLIALSEA